MIRDGGIYGKPPLYEMQKNLEKRDFTIGELSRQEEDQLIANYLLSVKDILPLTPAQDWLFHQQDVVSPHFYIQSLFKVNGLIQPDKFSCHVNELARKHEILRTAFMTSEDRVLQVVLRIRTIEIIYRNLEYTERAELDQTIDFILDADRRRGFDLSCDRLLRIGVFKTGPSEYGILVAQPQIVADGWDAGEIFQQLFDEQAKNNEIACVPQGRRTTFAEHLKKCSAQDHEPAYRYWCKRLANLPEAPGFPGYQPSSVPYEQEVSAISIDREASRLVYELAGGDRQRVVSILQSAWGLMLQVANQSKDVYFDVILSNRNAGREPVADTTNIINVMPIRVCCEDEMIVDELLKEQYMQNLLSLPFSYCNKSELDKIIGRKKGFKHFLNFHNLLVKSAPYAKIKPAFGAQQIAVNSFDFKGATLEVYFKEKGDKIVVEFAYDTHAMQKNKIAVMKEAFAIVLRVLVNHQRQTIGRVKELLNFNAIKVREYQMLDAMDVQAFLESIELFADLTHSELRALSGRAKCKYHMENDVIFQEGMNRDEAYFVMNGNVELSRRANHGWLSSLGIAGKGAFINYMDLVDRDRNQARAEAVTEDVIIVAVPMEKLRQLMEKDAKVMWRFMNRVMQETEKYQKLWISE